MTTNRRDIQRSFATTLNAKADKSRFQSATLGHPDGTVYITDRPGYVWARLGGENGQIIQLYARGLMAARNMPVVIQRLAHRPQDFGIVDLDLDAWPSQESGDTQGGWDGSAYIGKHGAQHWYYGGDAILVHLRAFTPLRVYAAGGMSIGVQPGIIPRAGVDLNIVGQVIDLTDEIPGTANQQRYSLITLNTTGALTVTSGTAVSGFQALSLANVPDTPTGHFRLAAIRLYYGQTTIGESATGTDIVDLRWPQESIAGSVYDLFGTQTANTVFAGPTTGAAALPAFRSLVVADLPAHNLLSATHGDTLADTVVRGDLIVGNATPKWARLAIGAANKVLQSDGTDAGWSTNTLTISGNSTINGILSEANVTQSHEVAAMGDSLTSEGTYLAQLITLIGAGWSGANHGATGQTTTAMLARFTADVITPGSAEYVVVFGGINDIAADVSAATIEANLQAMYTAAHNAGIKVIAVTITPFKGNTYWSAGRQVVLDAVNTWILTTAINVDYPIDAYTALEDPGTPDTLLAANDSGDKLHLSTVGYQLLGTTIHGGSTFTAKASFVNILASGTNIYLDQSLRSSDPVAFGSVAANTATIGAITTTGAIGLNLTNTGMIYSRFTGDVADRYRFGGGGAGGFLIQSLDAVTPRTLQVVSSGGVAKAAIDFETGNTTIAGTTLLQGVTTITAGSSTVITGGLIFTQTKTSTAAGVYKFADLTGTIDLPGNALGAQDFYLLNGLIQTAADATVYSNANLRAFYLSPRHNGTGTLGTVVGGFVDIFNLGAGQINTAIGHYSLVRNSSTGKIATVRNFSASNMTNTGGGTTADNQYGYYCESLTTGTANYAFYSAGLGRNRFGDDLSIVGGVDRTQLTVTGFTTQTSAVASIARADTSGTGVRPVLSLDFSGSGADNNGGSLPMLGRTTTTAASAIARLAWSLPTGTDASYKGRVTAYVSDKGGERQWLQVDTDGTNADAKIGGAATYLDVVDNGDAFFVGAGSGLPYGSCYGNEVGWSQASAAQDTWYVISDADMVDASGGLNLITHDGSGKLTATKAGRYVVVVSASVECSALNKHVQIGIAVNGTVVDCTPHYDVATPKAQLTISTNSIVVLAASGYVEAAIRTTDTGTPDLSVDHLAISIFQVGG